MGDVLPPKRQAVVDRLRRRIESYRRRQSDCIPRFDQSFNGLCEQNIQETRALKQRFLESKAKRAAKKTDKKQDSANNLHTQQKFLKRTAEELEPPGGSADAFEPPAKIQCTAQQQRPSAGAQQQQSSENLTKFSVEIVQQLEFTTSAANSQPQQISTNVTVKALTNASVKSDVSSPKSGPGTPGGRDIGNLVECKQEPDSEFVDLEQCAAALEKDVAANGASFPGFSDLIGDDTSDEIITSDAFKDLISEISDFHPEFMKDFDFEDKSVENAPPVSKAEEQVNLMGKHSPLPQYSPQPRMASYPPGLAELSPAAQTLKQMAEQHQHKTQLGITFSPAATRSPYAEFQFASSGGNDYLGSPGSGSNSGTYKQVPGTNSFVNSSAPEVMMQTAFNNRQQSPAQQQQQTPSKQQGGSTPMYATKQQYSPYGSPNHGSPQYMPPRGQTPQQHVFSSSTPPRPPSAGLQINQAQQMQITQQGQQIQVTAGQHMQLTGDLKPGVSVAAQQGMYFSHQQTPPSQRPAPSGPGSGDTYCVSQSQTINFTQQNLRQRPAGAGGRPGVDPTAGNRQVLEQQHAKLLQQQQQQQQQILRAQQSHMAGMGPRPPPPEYKANPQLMHGLVGQQQQRFTAANTRRVGQQPMPPSGPMMRPQQALHGGAGNMYMHHLPQHRMPGTYVTPGGRSNQRPPNVSIGPDGINIGGRGSAEWRHLLMSQQQSAVFGTQMRPTFTQGGHQGTFAMGGGQGSMQMTAAQQMQHAELVRNQTLPGSPVSQMQMISQQSAQGIANASQMSMNLQMSQSMSVSGGDGASPHHHAQQPPPQQQPIIGYGGSPVSAGGNPPATSSAPDFTLEFFEQLPPGDSSNFSAAAQELLNSLDSASTFNLDIL